VLFYSRLGLNCIGSLLVYFIAVYRVAKIYPPAKTVPATTADAIPIVVKNTMPATAKTDVVTDSIIDDVFIFLLLFNV